MFGFNVKFEAILRSVVRACARTNVVTTDMSDLSLERSIDLSSMKPLAALISASNND